MGFGPDELRNYVFLRNLLDVFKEQALKYCSNGEDEAERFKRVKEMRDALTCQGELPFLASAAGEYPYCGENRHCSGGVCVPDTARSGWLGDDPPNWNS